VRTGVNPGRVSEESVIPFYDNHSTAHIPNGLFANKVILVEGQTEELALPVYLKKVGLDSLQEGIEVIGVSGKGNLAKWWRFFTLYNIPTFICFDNDRTNDGDGNRRKDALKAIGIPVEELDDVLGNGDWNINDRFCVFGVDFETTMKASFEDYDQLEREVKEELGNSKHIVARTVAQRLEVNEDDEG
jgi:putative ATP-dependent endonuclease of the OLD family